MRIMLWRTMCAFALWAGLASAAAAAEWVEVSSPDARIVAGVRIGDDGAAEWRVARQGEPVQDAAPVGLRFADDPAPVRFTVEGVRRDSHDGIVDGLVGKASRARDAYSEATIALAERGGGGRRFELVVRAYDDGAAYRWRIVEARGAFALAEETAGFGLSPQAQAWPMPVAGFDSSYEEYYRHGPLQDVARPGELMVLPLLFRTPRGTWGALTEAALRDWAGLYLAREDGSTGLRGRLSPLPGAPGVVVRGTSPMSAPWRVVMLGDRPGALVESNLVALLNPPADGRDWSWVRPGKTSFPWWNDYAWPGASFTPGLNTATMLAYIDFCADNGIPMHSLDGYQDKAWYGGPIVPDGTPQDLTRATPAIDMPAVLAHARKRGVRLRLWTHWQPLRAQLDAALATWARWGIEGVMVDFMNRDDQEMVRFHEEVLRKAADHRLTVSFHGTYKPTGEARTWPNELTREAVRNQEYNKFSDNPGSTPEHETTVPFTRMLAGTLDYHQGGFDHVAPAAFAIRYTRPQVMGTRARALALYVVHDNRLPMVADTPVNYRDAAGWDFVVAVPSVWDETRVLAGEPGEFIAIARRLGDTWWLGAIADGTAREVEVTLPGSPTQAYRLTSHADAAGSLVAPMRTTATIRGGQRLVVRMQAAGGFAASMKPLGSDEGQAQAPDSGVSSLAAPDDATRIARGRF